MTIKIILPIAAAGHEFLKAWACDHFGGVTISEAIGLWRDPAGKIIEDRNKVYNIGVFSFEAYDLEVELQSCLHYLLYTSGEECIYYEVNGTPALYTTGKEVII